MFFLPKDIDKIGYNCLGKITDITSPMITENKPLGTRM